MPFNRVCARAECGHELPFHAPCESSFKPFGSTEEIEGLDVLRVLAQTRLRQKFCLARPTPKLLRLPAINLCLTLGVRAGAVESRFQFQRLIQLLQPQA